MPTDLGKQMDDVVILTMSEFGRTARAKRHERHRSRTRQRDVRSWEFRQRRKSLRRLERFERANQLNEGRDLAVTTDFRDVFAEVAYKHLGNKNLDKVFPGYAAKQGNFKGILG